MARDTKKWCCSKGGLMTIYATDGQGKAISSVARLFRFIRLHPYRLLMTAVGVNEWKFFWNVSRNFNIAELKQMISTVPVNEVPKETRHSFPASDTRQCLAVLLLLICWPSYINSLWFEVHTSGSESNQNITFETRKSPLSVLSFESTCPNKFQPVRQRWDCTWKKKRYFPSSSSTNFNSIQRPRHDNFNVIWFVMRSGCAQLDLCDPCSHIIAARQSISFLRACFGLASLTKHLPSCIVSYIGDRPMTNLLLFRCSWRSEDRTDCVAYIPFIFLGRRSGIYLDCIFAHHGNLHETGL